MFQFSGVLSDHFIKQLTHMKVQLCDDEVRELLLGRNFINCADDGYMLLYLEIYIVFTVLSFFYS